MGVPSISTPPPLGRTSVGCIGDSVYKKQWGQKHTFLAAGEIPQTDTGKRFTQTAVLPSVPRCISPKPPEVNGWESTVRRWEEIMWDVGRVACVPHMLLSSRRHFREAGQEGSRL